MLGAMMALFLPSIGAVRIASIPHELAVNRFSPGSGHSGALRTPLDRAMMPC